MLIEKDLSNIYHKFIEYMPDGLVFLESAANDSEKDIDYIVLNANKSFRKLIGIKRDKLLGSSIVKITKKAVIAGINFEDICNTAYNTENYNKFEYYSDVLNSWFIIHIYKYENNRFIIRFHNITEAKNRTEKIDILYESTVRFHDSTFIDIDYQWIADELAKLSGASFVLANIFNKEKMKTVTRGCSGLSEHILQAVRLLGYDIIGKAWEVKEEDLKVMKSKRLVQIGRLSDFILNRIPPLVVNFAEKVVNLGYCYGIGITHNDEILGSFIIMMRKGDRIEFPDIVELYVNQLGMMLLRKEAEQNIKKIDQQYRTVFNGSQDAMFLINVNSNISFSYEMINKGYETDVGISVDAVKGMTPVDIFGDIFGTKIEEHYNQCVSERSPITYEEEVTVSGKRKVWHTQLSPIINEGRVTQIVGSSRNITKLKEWENEIARERQLFKVTLHSIGDAVITTDTGNRIVILNKAAEELTGWSQEEASGKLLDEVLTIISEKKQDSLRYSSGQDEINVKQYAEYKLLISKTGNKKIISSSEAFIKDEFANILGEVIVFRDVTEEKRREEEVRYLGYHDKLTGLYNRAYFEEALTRLDNEAFMPLGIIMGDSNGLKMVNDVFGHDEGDKLLIRIGEIFKTICGDNDVVARVGGDEFAIILPNTSPEKINYIILSIKQMCSSRIMDSISPSIALGTSIKQSVSEDIKKVYKLAEDRMYNNKLVESKSIRSSIISSLKKMLKERTHETEAHAQRLRELSTEIGRIMGLDDNDLDELSLLAMLHDIGKIAIPDYILGKPSKLNEDEWKIMKDHSEIGYRIAVASPELVHIANLILSHHERWDGTGYPQRLKREEIPLLSRIIAVVDAYDAMTCDRPYQAAVKSEAALSELVRCSGTQFDPYIVEKFIELMQKK